MLTESIASRRLRVNFPTTEVHRLKWAKYLRGLASRIPTELPNMPISEHAEKFRVMPKGERYSGPLDLDRSPYLREIMDNMAPNSGVRDTYVMKGAQTGVTLVMECVMCYYIGYAPADQLMVFANADQYRKWVGRRLEPAINSYGYRDLIFAQEKRKSGKDSGDKLNSKEYIGGQMDLVSALSAASLRALTKRIMQIDEADGAKEQLDTGEGSYVDVATERTSAWGNHAKRLVNSTPTLAGQSVIERLHELGDQREWFVPCPYCGKFQLMKWPAFHSVTEAGILKDVYYQCEFCGDGIFEYQKIIFMPKGEWRPTATAQQRMTRSYHIAQWYSPLGFSPWLDIMDSYLKARGNPDKLRSFVNLKMGLPFKDRGARPKLEKVLELQGTYKSGTVPDGVLFLTAFVDVQQGYLNDPKNPPRLEMEICGHGIEFRTWSIVYKVFVGEEYGGGVKDPYAGAWAELMEYGNKTGMAFKRQDGFEFPVVIMFVDARDGTMTDTVYRFTERLPDTYPVGGFGSKGLKRRTKEGEADDELTTSNFKRYRIVRSGNVHFVQISTNYYKTNVYGNLNVSRREFDPQPPGFCDFPLDYQEPYFNMLTAEEHRRDGSFTAGGRRNEALDCRVGNMCAADLYLDMLVEKLRERYKKDYKPEELKLFINIYYALQYLAKQTGVDYDRYAPITKDKRKAV
jgi:phage terminase large subunit GpA-like protein